MPFLQLTLELGAADPAAAESACFGLGALSVTLADASDHPILEPAPGETPLWPEVRLRALWPAGADGALLAATLAAVLGLDPARIAAAGIADRAWEREWLRDFRPMRFGRRLWICPGGQRPPVDDGVLLELDPGLAFGTGTHPTTALCLEWLDGAELAGQTVLDYGCGSGILALAALRLGAASALATDIDPQALLATRENAARNGLAERLTVLEPGALPDRPRDLVIANILAGPLVELAPRLAALCAPGGSLLLAGLLEAQAAAVTAAYAACFDIGVASHREGWTLLAGRRTG